MLSQKFFVGLHFNIIIAELEAWLRITSISCSSRRFEFYSQYTPGTSYPPTAQLPQNLLPLASQTSALMSTYPRPDTHTHH